MPRANRYILPGYIDHLTHRCHDPTFLLKFSKDRHGYRRRLREAVTKQGPSLLSDNITSNRPSVFRKETVGFSRKTMDRFWPPKRAP